MAGHSKWANIKHRKARQDAVKGKAWSKCSRAIMAAVRQGGPDPETNLKLRYSIEDAKSVNMPKDTISKAIKKASGEGSDAASYEEVRYEGYGPGGVAIIVDCLTDNVQRTAPELRRSFEKHGGNLAKQGAVSFGFNSKSIILIESSKIDEDSIMELAMEAGAEDIRNEDGAWEVTGDPADFILLKEGFEHAGLEVDSAEVTMIPGSMVACDVEAGRKVLRLIDDLEESDDVQKVYTNADIPEESMNE
ncbi:MAG: YebC/PmpR family DNA-binding transcriptional regulator [Planctomycetota bacterium]|nr:YebC/PmpR family DNA-binding transcriptional regulator [Planctomycetota bacterium]